MNKTHLSDNDSNNRIDPSTTAHLRTRPKDHGGFPLLPRLIASSLGAGYLPKAPGTWGALLAIVLWLPLYIWLPGWWAFGITLTATAALTVAGTWASSVSERYWGKDPVIACVDETVGQWFTMLPLCFGAPWWEILLALALFRYFDIFKPLGIRRTESLPGGYGMMADDLLAALYSALILTALNCWLIW